MKTLVLVIVLVLAAVVYSQDRDTCRKLRRALKGVSRQKIKHREWELRKVAEAIKVTCKPGCKRTFASCKALKSEFEDIVDEIYGLERERRVLRKATEVACRKRCSKCDTKSYEDVERRGDRDGEEGEERGGRDEIDFKRLNREEEEFLRRRGDEFRPDSFMSQREFERRRPRHALDIVDDLLRREHPEKRRAIRKSLRRSFRGRRGGDQFKRRRRGGRGGRGRRGGRRGRGRRGGKRGGRRGQKSDEEKDEERQRKQIEQHRQQFQQLLPREQRKRNRRSRQQKEQQAPQYEFQQASFQFQQQPQQQPQDFSSFQQPQQFQQEPAQAFEYQATSFQQPQFQQFSQQPAYGQQQRRNRPKQQQQLDFTF